MSRRESPQGATRGKIYRLLDVISVFEGDDLLTDCCVAKKSLRVSDLEPAAEALSASKESSQKCEIL